MKKYVDESAQGIEISTRELCLAYPHFEGLCYFDSILNKMFFYDGENWLEFSGVGSNSNIKKLKENVKISKNEIYKAMFYQVYEDNKELRIELEKTEKEIRSLEEEVYNLRLKLKIPIGRKLLNLFKKE